MVIGLIEFGEDWKNNFFLGFRSFWDRFEVLLSIPVYILHGSIDYITI